MRENNNDNIPNIPLNINNSQINENNNPNPNINNNNPAQQNNNGLQSVTLHMLARWGKESENVGTVGKIKTNNSIAIWYALKTTMDYLRGRSNSKNETFKQKLDPLVKQNLKSISSYLKELGIKEKDIKDIDELAAAFGDIENRNENGKPVRICSYVNQDKISEIVNKYKTQKQSIEDLVFDELIKTEKDINNQKVLLAKHDFDDLKNTIQTGDQARDKKVFLSKAAKEFQDQVSKLDNVKEAEDQDKKIKGYNQAVQKLDKLIFHAMETHLKEFRYGNQGNKVEKNEVQQRLNDGTLFGSFGFQNVQQPVAPQGQQPPQQPVAPQGQQPLQQPVPQQKEFIEVDVNTKYFKGILEQIKGQLIKANAGDRKTLVQKLDGDKSDITDALSAWDECFNKLNENDKKTVRENGMELKNNQQPGNLNDGLKGISNDEAIEKITLEYDEYNDCVAKTLFDNPDKIEDTMSKLLKDLLLKEPGEKNCQKAKGNLKGMISQVNEQLAQVKSNDKYNQYKGKYLQFILRLDKKMGLRDVEFKQQKFFVPTFINQLFEINSGDNFGNLASNLETLGKDQDFTTFLSNIMQDDFAVDMIKNNFEQIEKDFKNAGYKATRRGKFKEEFWDNNLKGHLPFVGKWSDGRWKKNLVMLGGESLGGFALGSAFAAKLGLSLAGGILPAIGAAAVILVTAIAIAVLVSLIITLVKGFKDLKNNDGFYKPTQNDQASAKTSQTAYLNRIYTAFLTFGADEEKLKPLVKDSKAPEKSKRREFDNSSRGKFFKSMMKMKDFLKEHATGDLQKSLKDSKPFQILEGKNQEPPRNEHNENNNNEPVGH